MSPSSPIVHTAVRRMKDDDTAVWMTVIPDSPSLKSLCLDQYEKFVFFATYSNPMSVAKLNATNGAILAAHTHSALSEMQNDIKLHIPPDGSGFYVIAQKVATNTANICKYLYSNPGSEDCQEILSVVVLPFGQIMINIGQFYFTGVDTTFNNLHFYKVVYGSTATDWTKKMVCTMSTCSIARGETLLDDSKTKLISLFTYGVGSSGTNRYGYFVKFSVSDGSVTGGRYKTNISCSDIQGSLLYGNYLISTISCSPDSYLLLLNKLNGEFSTIKYPGTAFGCAADYNGR